MTDVRCPHCSAHVATGATWCGQCYTSLVREPVKPSRPPLRGDSALQVIGETAPGAVALAPDLPPPPPLPPGAIPPPPPPPQGAPKKLRVGKQPWPCHRCETVNPFEENVCKACGMRFLDALSEPGTSLPLIGPIDDLGRAGKFKIMALVGGSLSLVLLVVFTIAGFVLK